MKGFDEDNGFSAKVSPNQQRFESIIRYLQDFGLTEKEAMVYLMLSKASSATASEIVSATQLSNLQAYRAVKGLLNCGLVEVSLERPRRYTPLGIEQAIALLSQEPERKLLEFENKTPLLLKEWSALGELKADRSRSAFRIVQGSKNVLKFRLMLCQSAKKDIVAVMKPNELAKMVLESADDIFKRLTFRNVDVRALSEVNRYNVDASKRFLEFIKLHHVNHSHLVPFSIIDGQEVLICLSQDGKDGVPENAIWTNHPELVDVFREVFEGLWSASQDGTARVREIEDLLSAKF
jgi:sugar-specific transcriptional regulator TrmB